MGRGITICKIVCTCTSLVFIVLGASLKWGIFPAVVDAMIKSSLELTEDNTETWDAWKVPPITPFMKFTFFNVTNVDAVRAGTAKPNVNEVGPFSYREVREKTNILSIQDEISFGSYIHYEFDEEESCPTCKIDTEITVINPVMVIVSSLLENIHETEWPDIDIPFTNPDTNITSSIKLQALVEAVLTFIHAPLNALIKCEADIFADYCDDMFLTGTPDNMIFQGTDSGMLKALWFWITDTTVLPDVFPFPGGSLPTVLLHILQTLAPDDTFIDIDSVVVMIDYILNLAEIPPLIDLEEGKFGFFKGTNASKSWWKINSGKYDLENYNKVLEFDGMTSLPDSWWDNFGPTPSAHESGVPGICHDIIGTDGLAYSPSVDKDADIWLFNDQLCRSIWLSFEKEVDIKGIKTYQFSPDPSVFSMSNPNNYCYCPNVEKCAVAVPENDTWDMSGCTECIDGLLSLQGCQGAPVVMSTPHYLDGDPKLVEAIIGIKPNREKHVTYLNLEPMTGMPLQAHKRIQISVPVFPSSYFDCLKKAKQVVFPLVWVDEGADIDEENIKKAKGLLVTPFLAVDIGSGVMIGAGAVLLISVILHSIFGKK